jgi:Na+/proline symporter
MLDPTDAAGTRRHAPKYLALAGYAASCLAVAVGLHRLGLEGGWLIFALCAAAAALLWFVFLPLFRRLHAPADEG